MVPGGGHGGAAAVVQDPVEVRSLERAVLGVLDHKQMLTLGRVRVADDPSMVPGGGHGGGERGCERGSWSRGERGGERGGLGCCSRGGERGGGRVGERDLSSGPPP